IRITTSAMSENQSVGNRLIIEKWSMGARMPLSIGIPFVSDELYGKKTYFRISKFPFRFLGLKKIERNDLLAFNYPIENDKPIDMHPLLLSRCLGLPGEYIRLRGAQLYVNDQKIKRNNDALLCYSYPIESQNGVTALLDAAHIHQKTFQEKDSGFVYLTRYQYYSFNSEQPRKTIRLKIRSSSFDERRAVIPYEGFHLELNHRTYELWAEIINRYEGVNLKQTKDGLFEVDGKRVEDYTFRQNYYWLLNDHQGYLNDSRSFGIIPESHIIGKAWFVLFSPETKRFLQYI
ncbi:MAG: S26 family signal peptidase, partial [Bacteroidales bacterium]|nr:S26 family signal peptidase [Bacteroidales bacterium]